LTGPEPVPRHDAVLLTGGTARRMGGVDKPGLVVGGRPMALRVAEAVSGAARLVVVGPGYRGLHADVVTREEPAGSGPVAAVAAGLAHVTAPLVALLAADLPFVTSAEVRMLAGAVVGHDAAVLVDDTGADQYLVAVWSTPALRVALAGLGEPAGVSMRRLLAAAGSVERRRATGSGGAPPWFDCDTPDDLRRARRLDIRRRSTASRPGPGRM
jgi:Molybdopterin-guanine dinucleotide biosynthesis protein A